MIKRVMQVGVLSAAVGGPYLAANKEEWMPEFGASAEHSASFDPTVTLPGGKGGKPGAHGGRGGRTIAETPAAIDLNEVLQFEGSPQWVMSRWPRVTSGLSEVDLQGYRVPLVTGTGVDDLAGSLTYYFDKNQRIARIEFRGSTGDPRKLLAILTNRYKFLPQQSNDPGLSLFQVRWNGKAQSELKIRTAGVLRSDQPYTRYDLELAMKRP